MTRNELLEQLFDLYWNNTTTYESDRHGYAYISYADLIALEDICLKIESGEPFTGDGSSLFEQMGGTITNPESHPEWKACKA